MKEKMKQKNRILGMLLLVCLTFAFLGCLSPTTSTQDNRAIARSQLANVNLREIPAQSARMVPAATTVRAQSLAGDIIEDLFSSARGDRLFNRTVFGSIPDVTCGSCHVEGLNWQITPSHVQGLYSSNPTGPLFRGGTNADVRGGNTFNRLLTRATFLVPLTVPSNVTVVGCGTPAFPNAVIGPDGRCVVNFARSAGSIRNMALHENLLWDARETLLTEQALGAVRAHNNPLDNSQLPTLQQRIDLQNFQQLVPFSSLGLRAWAYSQRYGGSVPPPGLPAGTTASEIRGRAFFEPGCPPGSPGCAPQGVPSGMCAQCHGGVMMDSASWDNILPSFRPDGTPEPNLSNNFVSEFNLTNDTVYQFLIQEPLDPPGSPPRVVFSPDPGLVLTTGSLCSRSFLNCILNPGSGLSVFRTSSLRGMRQKIELGIPFFHNNSALTVQEMMAHYVQFGQLTAFLIQQAGTFPPGTAERFLLSPGDVEDIIAYLRLL